MVTSDTVAVVVTKLRPRLLKVEHPNGYQLVAGGRLLLDCAGGRKTPHPDLPPYVPSMFPTPYSEWSWADDMSNTTKVWIVGDKRTRQIGSVRAHTLLFTPIDCDVVRDWLRSKR